MFQVLSTFDLRKTYPSRMGGRIEALKSVNLQVRGGEIYGLLGPNGAGKTSTLRIVVGLAKADSGRVLLFGEEQVGPELLRKIGFVPENATFPAHLSPGGLLSLTCALRGVPGDARGDLILSVLQEVGLEHAMDRSVRELSRGMTQRLALANALVGSPKLLILDEPTAGFDPLGRVWFKKFMRLLQLKGVTILLSSHLLTEVQEICDRVGILHAGRTVVEDSVQHLLGPDGPGGSNLEEVFVNLIEERSGGEDLEPRPRHRL